MYRHMYMYDVVDVVDVHMTTYFLTDSSSCSSQPIKCCSRSRVLFSLVLIELVCPPALEPAGGQRPAPSWQHGLDCLLDHTCWDPTIAAAPRHQHLDGQSELGAAHEAAVRSELPRRSAKVR